MKKLFIDIPALIEAGDAVKDIQCSYYYHRKNDGALSLLEVAEFATYCRECKAAFCALACPKEALEHTESGMMKRYNMRCVGCKSCVYACPFGTIFPEVMNYITSKCDYCLQQLQDNPDFVPQCVITAPEGAIVIRDIADEDPGNHIHFYGDHLAIRSQHWRRKEGKV